MRLWIDVGACGDPNHFFKDLLGCYSEPHRAYHVLDHILVSLAEIAVVHWQARDVNAIRMAIWYHDAVYDPRRGDNEERSAVLAYLAMQNMELDIDFIERVIRHILATKHNVLPTDFDTQLLVDVDLAVLGQGAEIFDVYNRGIRKEYDWVSPVDYARERSEVLRRFLKRPHIYLSEHFREKYEIKARANIFRALAHLAKDLPR
ncbi:N-methyl-D-aspartate receptor NMDAR2C subunit [Candidatus Jorgensenbacteria bacterium]|nr:N-methyl-D-aspartate receptor NMDAR2C subunit [Candidatus Jorgensenbacteria bacterium]